MQAHAAHGHQTPRFLSVFCNDTFISNPSTLRNSRQQASAKLLKGRAQNFRPLRITTKQLHRHPFGFLENGRNLMEVPRQVTLG